MFTNSAIWWLTGVRRSRFWGGIVSIPIFSERLAMIETKSQFPVRSPYPFIVPWTCIAPAMTPASALATPQPVSLCKCTPIPVSR